MTEITTIRADDLDRAYAEMAQDADHEREALEWIEGLLCGGRCEEQVSRLHGPSGWD